MIKELASKTSIHPLFWLVIAIGIVTGHFKQLLIIFLIVFIHEMGHAMTAHFFRWRIKKIEMLPFGGVAEVDEHGNRPFREECLVILAGPFMNVVLICFAYLFSELGMIDDFTYEMFMVHNLILLIFNLLPIWPLDGGKLLFLFISLFIPFHKAQKVAIIASSILLLLFSLFCFLTYPESLHSWIVISFLIVAHYTEWKQLQFTHIRFLLERYYGKGANITRLKPLYVKNTDTLFEIMLHFCRGCKHQVVVQGTQNGQEIIDENELLHAYFTDKRTTETIDEIIHF